MTHGRLAIELLNAAEMIVGETNHITAVSIGWHDDVQTATGMIQKALERLQGTDGILILTDMFGGTPTNIASTFLDHEKIEVVTGVNLPMLLKLVQIGEGETLAAAAKMVREQGQNSIYIASQFLAPGQQS